MGALLLLASLTGNAWLLGPVDPGITLPTLTHVVEVRLLSIEEARRGYPVQLRGVVTYFEPGTPLLFFQDVTSGVRVRFAGEFPPPAQGQLVELRGRTAAGNWAPFIVEPAFALLADCAPFPEPIEARGDHLAAEALHAQWTVVHGIVRSAVKIRGKLQIELWDGSTPILAVLKDPGTNFDAPGRLSLAEVRLRGVCESRRARRDGPLAVRMLVRSPADVEIVRRAPADPFLGPTNPLAELTSLSPDRDRGRILRVEGRILEWIDEREARIHDGTGEVSVRLAEALDPRPGDYLDAVGVLDFEGGQPFVGSSVARLMSLPCIFPQPHGGTGAVGTTEREVVARELLPVLLRADDVRRLSPAAAARGYPARLNAIVTFHDPEWNILYVQDRSAGIFVYTQVQDGPLAAGDRVNLDGMSLPGEFSPVVALYQPLVPMGRRPLDSPQLLSPHILITGAMDGQWVEVEGLVRGAQIDGKHVILEFAWKDRLFKVYVYPFRGDFRPNEWIDAEVRFQGVCSALFNRDRQVNGFQFFVPGKEFIHVVDPAPGDPFLQRAQTLESLLRFNPEEKRRRRVKVEGVVTYVRDEGLFTLSDPTGAVFVRRVDEDRGALEPGDRVEVVGLPEEDERFYGAQLLFARSRNLGKTEPPPPQEIRAQDVLKQLPNARLIRVRGQLMDSIPGERAQLLVFGEGVPAFRAVLDTSGGGDELRGFEPRSQLQLTGICSILLDRRQRPSTFRLLLRGVHDVQVLARPPWWEFRRFRTALIVVVAVGLAGLAWVITLKRKVRKQTSVICGQVEKEAALARKHQQLVENAHDMIFTHDLEGRITSMNRAGERITGYSRKEVCRMNLDQLLAPGQEDRIRSLVAEAGAEGAPAVREIAFLALSGKRVLMEVSSPPIRRDGAIIGFQSIARDITRRREAEIKIRDYSDRLRSLSHQLLESQEAERRHLARELHDEIGQSLTALKITLQSLPHSDGPQQHSGRLGESIQVVEDLLHSIRSLSLNLRPSILDDFGLVSAIKWYLEAQSRRTGIVASLDADSTETGRRNPEIETACFRVVQEAVTNAVRHSRARHVWVKCQEAADSLHLCIQDDGVGFDPAVVRERALRGESLGILSMQERVQLLGGQIDVDSLPGKGTRICVRIPLPVTDDRLASRN